MHCGYVSRSATVVRVFFVRLRMLSAAALPATAHTVLSDRLSVPVISDALSERMSSASRTVRYGPATSASPSWVPSMEKESTTMSTVPSVSAEARMAGDSCLNTICFSAYPRVFATYLATSMSKPEYSPPCRYPSPGWSAATPIATSAPAPRLWSPRKPMCRTRRRRPQVMPRMPPRPRIALFPSWTSLEHARPGEEPGDDRRKDQ